MVLNENKCNTSRMDKEEDLLAIEADQIFQNLITEGLNTPGDHGIAYKDITLDINNKPIPSEVLKDGKAYFHRNYFGIAWAIILTEFVQYPIQRITAFVLRNERYNGPQFAYMRGVMTFIHIFKWFDLKDDIADNKTSKSTKDMDLIRRTHRAALKRLQKVQPPKPNKPISKRLHILEAIRQDLAHIEDPPYLDQIMTLSPSTPMSQFDMNIVLGVFYFILDFSSSSVGLYDLNGYENYITYLGILGRYLGIEDRFNLPLLPNPKVRKLVSKRIWDEIMTPCFKNFKEDDFINLNYFAENGFLINPFELVMHLLVKDLLFQPAKQTEKYLNRIDRLLINYVTPFLLYLVQFPIILYIVNVLMKFWFWIGEFTTSSKRKAINQTFLWAPLNPDSTTKNGATAAAASTKCLF